MRRAITFVGGRLGIGVEPETLNPKMSRAARFHVFPFPRETGREESRSWPEAGAGPSRRSSRRTLDFPDRRHFTWIVHLLNFLIAQTLLTLSPSAGYSSKTHNQKVNRFKEVNFFTARRVPRTPI